MLRKSIWLPPLVTASSLELRVDIPKDNGNYARIVQSFELNMWGDRMAEALRRFADSIEDNAK